MDKLEKVIKGLECHLGNDKNHYDCDNCQYGPMNNECDAKLVADTLALLKAQEAVKPIRDINGVYYCGGCGEICLGYESEYSHSIIKIEHQNYCHKCGRRVKWE